MNYIQALKKMIKVSKKINKLHEKQIKKIKEALK
jgi:hypothetical protein